MKHNSRKKQYVKERALLCSQSILFTKMQQLKFGSLALACHLSSRCFFLSFTCCYVIVHSQHQQLTQTAIIYFARASAIWETCQAHLIPAPAISAEEAPWRLKDLLLRWFTLMGGMCVLASGWGLMWPLARGLCGLLHGAAGAPKVALIQQIRRSCQSHMA